MLAKTTLRKAPTVMNNLAKEGWEVVAQSPNSFWGAGLVITFVREVKNSK